MDKCKNCQWHNKPYWSIINPCDNCFREDKYVEILTRWEDPTVKELQQRIDRAIEYIKKTRYKECYETKGNFDYELLEILKGDGSNDSKRDV